MKTRKRVDREKTNGAKSERGKLALVNGLD